MFGGPQIMPTAAEIQAQEDEAVQTVQSFIVGAIALWLSPFAIDYVRKLV